MHQPGRDVESLPAGGHQESEDIVGVGIGEHPDHPLGPKQLHPERVDGEHGKDDGSGRYGQPKVTQPAGDQWPKEQRQDDKPDRDDDGGKRQDLLADQQLCRPRQAKARADQGARISAPDQDFIECEQDQRGKEGNCNVDVPW